MYRDCGIKCKFLYTTMKRREKKKGETYLLTGSRNWINIGPGG